MRVMICADPKNGNAAQEVGSELSALPRRGDTLSVLVPTGETMLTVEDVAFQPGGGYPRVWVRLDGYSLHDLDEAIASLQTGYAAGANDDVEAVRAAMRWAEDA